jgi:hypothetical protein
MTTLSVNAQTEDGADAGKAQGMTGTTGQCVCMEWSALIQSAFTYVTTTCVMVLTLMPVHSTLLSLQGRTQVQTLAPTVTTLQGRVVGSS